MSDLISELGALCQKLDRPDALLVRRAIDELRYLTAEIRRIADDFHPDKESEAPSALQEMRNELSALVSA